MKKVLVVEDEMFALEDLRDSIREIMPALEITALQTASEALEVLQRETFDAVFLDIELPGMSGIDMLQRLKPPVPPVVLVTAHALHALDAFGLGVIECLLKPVDQERLRRSLLKISTQGTHGAIHVPATRDPEEVIDRESRILIRDGEKIWMVKVGQIIRLEQTEGGSRVFFPQGNGLVRRSLSDFDDHLDGRYFFRINDRQIVNLDCIDRFTSSPQGRFVAHFPDGMQFEFSSEQSRAFEQRHSQ